MKILFLSDLHGKGINKKYLNKLNTYDIIISLWDNTYEDLLPLKNLNVHKIWIHWNHDKIKFWENDWFNDLNIQNIHLQKISIKGVSFLWFDGDMRYVFAESNTFKNNKKLKQNQNELSELLKFKGVDIFISHFPSFWILDRPNATAHRWLKAFKSFIESEQPVYHFFGHMHINKSKQINKTNYQCVYNYFELNDYEKKF